MYLVTKNPNFRLQIYPPVNARYQKILYAPHNLGLYRNRNRQAYLRRGTSSAASAVATAARAGDCLTRAFRQAIVFPFVHECGDADAHRLRASGDDDEIVG